MTFKRCRARSALACALVVLAGCATVYEGRYAFNDGWREARIEQIGSATSLSVISASDCRHTLPADRASQSDFALVAYADFGHLRRRIVTLPFHTRFEAGDAVYIKLRSCSGDVAHQRASSQ